MDCKRCGNPVEQRSGRGRPRSYCGSECWDHADKLSRQTSWAKRTERYWRLRQAGYPSKVAMAARDSEERTIRLLAGMEANRVMENILGPDPGVKGWDY